MERKVKYYAVTALFMIFCTLCISTAALAAEDQGGADGEQGGKKEAQRQGPPPARVVTATARSGEVRPQFTYVGSVYFPEVSEVAAEVAGRVDSYNFEEGRSVAMGQELVELDTELVEKDLETAKFEYRNVFSSLENARRELQRINALYRKKTVSEQDYDKAFYLVAGLENRATALQAKVARLEIQLEKSVVKAPFDGLVLERLVDRGEWVNPGTPVAILARNDTVDVVVHVPENVLPFLHEGMPLAAEVGGRRLDGEVRAVIPRGDVATRTFPVKIRAVNDGTLAEGMEARVRVPAGEKREAVLVPRDALLLAMDRNQVWVVFGDKAVSIPVEVTAYLDADVAVRSLDPATELAPGMQVVVKGNERLRPGQPVVVVGGDAGAGGQAPDGEKPAPAKQ